jgi:hypothetical protein
MKSNKNKITYHTNIALTIFGLSVSVFLMSVFFVQTDFHVSNVVTIAKHVVYAEGAEGVGNGAQDAGGVGVSVGGSGSNSDGPGSSAPETSAGVDTPGCCTSSSPSDGPPSSAPETSAGVDTPGCCGPTTEPPTPVDNVQGVLDVPIPHEPPVVVIDVCPNIPGDQNSVPSGLIVDSNGNCVPPTTDVCPNLPGDQATLPPGWSIDAHGNCVPPTVCVVTVPLAITSPLTASGAVATPFSYTITSTGDAPIAVTATGSLPAGMSYDPATKTISGTPTVAGVFNVTISATNPCEQKTAILVITITGSSCSIVPPRVTSSLSSGGVVGTAFTYTITTSGGAPITVTTSGTLPSGLTYDSATGIISGTPTAAGTSNYTITATNPCGNDTETLVITTSTPGCTVNCGGGGGGCSVNCGGGGGGPNPAAVFLFKVASSSPLASASIYLSQIPYTGFGDSALIFLFFAGLALFSYNVVMFLNKRKWAQLGTSAQEMQSIFVTPQANQAPVATTQLTASDIAHEVGAAVSGIFEQHIAPQLKTAVEERVPVTINVSIGNIHVGNNVTTNTTTTNNKSATVAEPVQIEAPKAQIIEATVEATIPVDNQLLVEALRAKANDERILISPVGFDSIVNQAQGNSDASLELITRRIEEAKGTYPRQHGWIELNKEKVTALLATVTV